MQALIRDLRQFSGVETLAKAPVRPNANVVAADVVRAMRTSAEELGATITVEPLPTVMVDPPQLEQVLVNLVANAIKYRWPDVSPGVRISASWCGDLREFAVLDNGIGIEPEYFDRIFQMFPRLQTTDEYEGTTFFPLPGV